MEVRLTRHRQKSKPNPMRARLLQWKLLKGKQLPDRVPKSAEIGAAGDGAAAAREATPRPRMAYQWTKHPSPNSEGLTRLGRSHRSRSSKPEQTDRNLL